MKKIGKQLDAENLFAQATEATEAARRATAVADREGTIASHRTAAKAQP